MLDADKVKAEALFIRKLLEQCDKNNTRLVAEDFPVNNCKLASMIFIYHLFTLWPDAEIFGVSGVDKNNKGKETITHHWVEIGDIAIDIKADQYSDIDRVCLSKKIINKMPFEPICVGNKGDILQCKLFRIVCRDKYDADFSTVGEDFIEDMEIDYSLLMELVQYT